MAVNLEERSNLAESLSRLVDGEMDTLDFEQHYYDTWIDSDDAAVADVADFAASLYSHELGPSGLLSPSDLTENARNDADRAILFLETDLEYQWPESEIDSALNMIGTLGLYGIPVGVAFLAIAVLMFLQRDWEYTILLGGIGIVALIPIAFFTFFDERRRKLERARIVTIGDLDFWPFIGSDDYEQAKESCEIPSQ